MSRKIKDIKDKHTGELVYPRTHVSAVVLSSDSTLDELIEVKQDKLVSGTNIKTINGTSILGSGDIMINEGDTDIIVTNKSDLDELYKDVAEGTKAVVVNTISDVLGVNLFDFFIGNIEGALEVFEHPEAYTLKISSVDTNIELPVSTTSDVMVEVPFNNLISIEMGSDLASVYRILVRKGYNEEVWSNGYWHNVSYLIGNEMSLLTLFSLGYNILTSFMTIAPALIVDFVGTKTITEYVKNGDNWEVWSKGESGLNIQLSNLIYSISQDIPTKTSQLDNDSNFVTSNELKTINGESIIGSGNITIEGGGNSDANVAAVDTGDVLDDVTVAYATKTYVDGLVGDINSVLESIINS